MLNIYGLKNCDTCKKAIKWLENSKIEFEFIDIRNPAPNKEVLENWLNQVGDKVLVNRRSTSWRALSDAQKMCNDAASFIDLLNDNATLIKRPVFSKGQKIMVGFAQKDIEKLNNFVKNT